jgi:hypothetical protein
MPVNRLTTTSEAMTDRIDARLRELRAEYEAGQKMLADLDTRRSALTNTLLRIDGAIRVLQELGAADNVVRLGAAET